MNDPRQYLVHLTNRGSKVGTDVAGGVGQFQCYTNQPMKDINKFGLIHYSIPKMLDSLDRNNCSFTIRVFYKRAQGAGRNYADIPVTMPLMDYYNQVASQKYDMSVDQKSPVQAVPVNANATEMMGPGSFESNFGRLKDTLAFDEVLQVTINWAIQREWRKQYVTAGATQAAGNNMEHRINALSRLSCVVKMEQGKFVLYFGYRGHDNNVNHVPFEDTGITGQYDSAHSSQMWNAGQFPGTGMPCRVLAVANYVDAGITNGGYSFIDVNGAIHNNHRVFAVTANVTPDNLEEIALNQIELHYLTPRMQMFLGATKAVVSSNTHVGTGADPSIKRGWVTLTNYIGVADQDVNDTKRLGLIKLEMDVQPNLDPPSFLMLNLTAQGTRTKVLGHENEKGGWAIPTPPSNFRSKYDNQPKSRFYDSGMCRSMPVILAATTPTLKYAAWQTNFSCRFDQTNQRAASGLGYNYDPIPRQGLAPIGGDLVRPVNNFSLVHIATHGASRHIISGGTGATPECPARKFTRSGTLARGGANSAGFGTGNFKQSSVFTVSMIEPNWIWCTVPDSTVQTLDVQLAWGDTSETVTSESGNPVQFSIIASP